MMMLKNVRKSKSECGLKTQERAIIISSKVPASIVPKANSSANGYPNLDILEKVGVRVLQVPYPTSRGRLLETWRPSIVRLAMSVFDRSRSISTFHPETNCMSPTFGSPSAPLLMFPTVNPKTFLLSLLLA